MDDALIGSIVAMFNRDLIDHIAAMGDEDITDTQKKASAAALHELFIAASQPEVDEKKIGLHFSAKIHATFPHIDLEEEEAAAEFFDEMFEAVDVFISLAQEMKGMNAEEQKAFTDFILADE